MDSRDEESCGCQSDAETRTRRVPTPRGLRDQTGQWEVSPRAMPLYSRGGVNLDEFGAGLGGNRVTGITAVVDIQLDRLANVAERVGARVPLADAAGQDGDGGDVPAIGFPFQNHRVAHLIVSG